MKKQWNKDIHDRLKDFPMKAPEGLLDDIKSEMHRRGFSSAPVPGKRPATVLRIAAVAAMALLLAGISHLFRWQQPPVLPDGQDNVISPVAAEILQPSGGEKEMSSVIPPIPVASRLSAQAVPAPVEAPDSTEEKSSGEENEPPVRPVPRARKGTDETSRRPVWAQASPRKGISAFDVSVYCSGLLAIHVPTGGETDMVSSAPSYSERNDSTAVASRAISRTFKRNRHGEAVKHHLPVKLGVSFRYNLNDRWSLQSGLTYSYLASDFSYNGFDASYETKQKLHYIGIPLQVGYRIWENKQFRSYISAGGQVDKLVSGKATTRYAMDDGSTGTLVETVRDNRLLFSALASVGFEYALGKDFSLYAEPGIHYYFKNGNGLQTHYNEQPLNFNITVGFRFHWKR